MKIGCCGDTDSYRAISKMGYDYCELSGRKLMALSEYQREDFLRDYEKTGFPCLALNDYCGEDVPIVGPDYTTKAIRTYAQSIMPYAAKLGVKSVGIGAPAARKLPEGYPEKEAMFEMMEFLYITCEEAAKYDIQVLLEAIAPEWADFVNTTDEALKIVKALRNPLSEDLDEDTRKLAVTAVAGRKTPHNLYIVYDLYHSKLAGEDLSALVRASSLVKHLHYSTDLGELDRGYPGPEQLEELTNFLRVASECEYKGNISVEGNYGRHLNYDGELAARIMKMALPH